MPLLEKNTPQGRVLIAQPPVAEGEHALIRLKSGLVVKLIHPKGLIINNWPALTPVLDSLPSDVCATIIKQMQAADQPPLPWPICVGVRRGNQLQIKLPESVPRPRIYTLGVIEDIVIVPSDSPTSPR